MIKLFFWNLSSLWFSLFFFFSSFFSFLAPSRRSTLLSYLGWRAQTIVNVMNQRSTGWMPRTFMAWVQDHFPCSGRVWQSRYGYHYHQFISTRLRATLTNQAKDPSCRCCCCCYCCGCCCYPCSYASSCSFFFGWLNPQLACWAKIIMNCHLTGCAHLTTHPPTIHQRHC